LPTAAQIRELLAEGTVLRGFLLTRDLEPERFGFFSYNHDPQYSAPYVLVGRPPAPVHLDDLPAEVARTVGECRLPVDFSREPILQPFEHLPSQAWDDAWYSTTGQLVQVGQEAAQGPSPTSWWDVVPPGKIAGRSMLATLVEAWLRLEPLALDVLNDYLVEASQSPLPEVEGPAARLDEVLSRFMSPAELLAIEADFVEHSVRKLELPSEIVSAVRQSIEAARRFQVGQAQEADLSAAASAAERCTWQEEAQPDIRAAWAAQALARRWPLVAARTARTIVPDETAWQVEYVVRLLDAR
jgi:hypothetical protein